MKGREPVLEFVPVRADSDVEVGPSRAVIGETVDVGVTVEPAGPTGVLDTVVDGANVVDVVIVELDGAAEVVVVGAIVVVEVVVVVVGTSEVLVLVVGGEHVDANVTDADAAAWKPSDQIACTDNVMSPVSAPGTMVSAEVWAWPATSE
ncbi:MAG TPA: hypothetical protein VGC84_03420 [Ilumatobacteraceae bacterium]